MDSSGYGSYGGNQQPQGGSYQQQRGSGFSLFVGGLAFSATEQDVRHALSHAGNITNIRIVSDRETGRPKGFCFVEFDSQESVDKAIREYNGIEICGRPIRVDAGGKGKGKGSSSGGSSYPPQQQGSSYGNQSYDRGTPYGGAPSGGYDNQSRYQDPYKSSGRTDSYGGRNDYSRDQSYNRQPEGGSSYNRPQQTQEYSRGGHQSYSRPADSSSYNQAPAYRQPAESNAYGRYPPRDAGRDRSRSRGRSPSESSSVKERRQRERQARKEQFAKGNSGWDRAPNSDELAQQEAERAAVRAAEAQGKDITTIRADLLKQAQWKESSNSYNY
jgi:RNA recognition motif-containing protein